MASRDLILRIPKEKYERLIQQLKLDRNFRECEITELQKGHGKIVDANCVLRNCDCWEVETALQLTEAIIGADQDG